LLQYRDRRHCREKVLLSGHVPDSLYQLDRIDTAKPFAELEKLSA
jgi:hypothetical protein